MPGLESDDSAGGPEPAYSAASARALVAESASDLAAHSITRRDHEALLAVVRAGLGPAKQLAVLAGTAHTPLAALEPAALPEELRADDMLGYLGAAHEDEYLAALDAGLDAPLDAPYARPAERSNPASTYNWLRRFKPDVLSADPHAATSAGGGGETVDVKLEGGSAGGGDGADASSARRDTGPARKESGRVKRASAANMQELLDDMGYVIGEMPADSARGGSGSGRSKRKRDDEPYRPKGGSGSRARRKPSEGGGRTPAARKGPAE